MRRKNTMNPVSSPRIRLQVARESRLLKAPFRITGYTFERMETVTVTLVEGGCSGSGEAFGVYYHDETPKSMLQQIESVRKEIEGGANRVELQSLLPAGGARNALDCALWDLEAQRARRPVWALAGLEPPKPLRTAFTIGADTPERMEAAARQATVARLVKVKLTGEPEDAERVRAVRTARPEVTLIVDANQGLTREGFLQLLPTLLQADVKLVEQPFPVGHEAELDSLPHSVPIAGDESIQDTGDLESSIDRFDVVNIKLDKCGGLTEALIMAGKARAMGMGLMVGCMLGTSLAMAPAFVVGQLCDVVDLDGPRSLRSDRVPSVGYKDGAIWCPETVWGAPREFATQ